MPILVNTAGGAEIKIEHFTQAEFHEITGPYTKDGYSVKDPRMKWDVWGPKEDGVQRFSFDGAAEEFMGAFDLSRPQEETWEDVVLQILVRLEAELVRIRTALESGNESQAEFMAAASFAMGEKFGEDVKKAESGK